MGITGQWRRYNIFISSTFKDMDYERDVIKFRVIPELNRRYRDSRVELQAIDLRLGVNTAHLTEEESERKVLSVCTSCIDSARPFFIGLIGHRYGWVPSEKRWQEFISSLSDDEAQLLSDTAGCSVTEMEIVYGALSQSKFDNSHVLFFLRDEDSYKNIPPEIKSGFYDNSSDSEEKLTALKTKIIRLFGERAGDDDRCTSYHLDWKNGQFISEDFETIVTEQLSRQIESEIKRIDNSGNSTWWVQEKELEESTLLRLLPGSIQLPIYDEKSNDVVENDSDGALWYIQGHGASTYLAQSYGKWDEDEDVVRLVAVFGLSEYSSSVRPVLVRWIHELWSEEYGVEIPSDDDMLYNIPESQLYPIFESLVEKAREADKYIYIYMDDLEALEITAPKDLYMPWLSRVKDDVNLLVNLQDDSEARKKFLSAHKSLSRNMIVGVQGNGELAEELIAKYEKSFFLELPEKVKNQMLKAAGGFKQSITPLKIHSIFRLFESLSQEDFAEIRTADGSQIDAINSYLENIWAEMPDLPYDIMTFMVNNIAKNIGLSENMRQAIWTVAAAPGGLREKDIAHFAAEDWDEMQFYRAMNFLFDFFYEDRARHLWRAKYLTYEQDGLLNRQKSISEYIRALDEDDSLRESRGLYYAVACGEPEHYLSYTSSDDYMHGKSMSYILHFCGPQVRELLREGYIEGKNFKKYCADLDISSRLQLFATILASLGDMKEKVFSLGAEFAQILKDVEYEKLKAVDAYTYATLLMFKGGLSNLEKALAVMEYCVKLDYPDSRKMLEVLKSRLIETYRKFGMKRKAERLANEIERTSFESILPILRNGKIDEFLTEYWRICDSLPLDSIENAKKVFGSSQIFIEALIAYSKTGHHKETLAEAIRFLPVWQSLQEMFKDFYADEGALEKAAAYYLVIAKSSNGLNAEIERIAGEQLMAMALARLNEIAPDNDVIKHLCAENDRRELFAKMLEKDNFRELEDRIREIYNTEVIC